MDILKGYVRDPATQAVINKDERDYKDHYFKVEMYRELSEIKHEINFLREELSRTKALLANLEEKK